MIRGALQAMLDFAKEAENENAGYSIEIVTTNSSIIQGVVVDYGPGWVRMQDSSRNNKDTWVNESAVAWCETNW